MLFVVFRHYFRLNFCPDIVGAELDDLMFALPHIGHAEIELASPL